jgi:DNA repair exonuclease SbcCD ATPase subunit
MQSLQRLKERKRAIAQQMTASLSKSVDLKLTTQAMDIAYLKKERDQSTKDRAEERAQIIRRLDDLEAISARYYSLMDRPETLKVVHEAVKPLADRLEALERSTVDLPYLQKGLQDLATVPIRLATLETRQTVVQPEPETNQLNILDNPDLKSITERLSSLEAANGALAEIPKLRHDITSLKTAKQLHKIEIDTLKTWTDRQPKAVSEETMKNLIQTEVQEKAAFLSKTLREKAEEANRKLVERITKTETSTRDLQTELASFRDFKEEVEKQKLPDQISALYDNVKTIEGNDAKTYAKADKLQTRLKKLEDAISPDDIDEIIAKMNRLEDRLHDKSQDLKDLRGDLKDTNKDLLNLEDEVNLQKQNLVKYIGNLEGDFANTGFSLSQRVASLRTTVTQSELGRLPIRLNELEKSARHLDKLSGRIDELEKAQKGPGFRRVGATVFSSPGSNTPDVGDLNEQVKALEKSLQKLRKSVEGTNGLSSQVDAHEQRINSMEAASASARPLDTVEQTVETTGDKTLDKTVERTVEKAAEKKIKALVSSERKSTERNLGELETRLMGEIQASRNRAHGSSVSSAPADATVAQLAHSDMSALNQHIDEIRADIDSAMDRLSNHDASITLLQDVIPTLFSENFDPFKVKMEEQLRTTTNILEAHDHKISNLAQLASNPPPQQNSFGQQEQAQLNAIVADATALKTDLEALRSSLLKKADAERISQELEGFNFVLRSVESRWENISTDDIYQRMVRWFTQMYPGLPQIQEDIAQLKALKAWIDPRAGALDGLSRDAVNLYNLTSIAPQLRDLANVNTQVLGLVNSSAQLYRLANSAPTLEHLVANISQLQSLIKSHDELPQTLVKVDQACSDAKIAITSANQAITDANTATTKAEQASSEASTAITRAEQASSDAMVANTKAEQVASEAKTANKKTTEIEQRLIEEVNALENLGGTVAAVQKSLHKLNSDQSSFAKASVVETLTTQLDLMKRESGASTEVKDMIESLKGVVENLKTALDEETNERIVSVHELRKTVNKNNRSRAQAEADIKKSINDNNSKRDTVEAVIRTSIDENIQALRSALDTLKSECNTIETKIQKSVQNLERSLEAFQTDVSDKQSASSLTIQTLRSDFDTDRGKRDTTERDIRELINDLNRTTSPDTAPFAKAEALDALKEALQTLQGKFLINEKARSELYKQLRIDVSAEADKMSKLEKETKEFSNQFKQLKSNYDATLPRIWEQIGDVQGASTDLRKEFDKTVETFIEPNRDFFGLLGTVIMIISQLQQVVESLNQNLPVAPLKLEWQCYLPKLGK